MKELDDLDQYNGDTEHYMRVDFTYHESTGELADEFDDEDLDSGISRPSTGSEWRGSLVSGFPSERS